MSTLRTDTLANSGGTKSVPVNTVVDGSAKAWVNFNGTGTVAIRASFNVSSITDSGTGDYTVNFTTAMVDTNYTPVVSVNGTVSNYAIPFDMNTSVYTARGTSAYRFNSLYSINNLGGGQLCDSTNAYVAIFR